MNSLNKYFPKSKKISIDKFVSNALYDKNYGYYSKKIPFGKNGDFITSPGVSSLFSEMIALWVIAFWEHIDKPKIFKSKTLKNLQQKNLNLEKINWISKFKKIKKGPVIFFWK